LVDKVGFGCLEPPVSPAGHLLLPGVLLSFQQGGLTTKHTLNIVFGLTIKTAVISLGTENINCYTVIYYYNRCITFKYSTYTRTKVSFGLNVKS
jgi:hypothetical protein